ncbi:hypothetical protein SS50377_27337 [Spironucleus salmonicida]|uniref:Transmembrane protein n=1 Tax=Spironucleus salmonicida TaxID=348837 RepID=V6LFT6_9EUKA|nr:hypothetical protein SS50377_27337 [Spironucleus salmonicida]|eukprot:EST43362.1 Hypothetical protein SS50377_17041 [Spironucleus salmonicida]
MISMLMVTVNLTELIQITNQYQSTLDSYQSDFKNKVEYLESQSLYYDPPVFIQPEYFDQKNTIPANFPSSYLKNPSFDIKKNMQIQFENIQQFIQSIKFDNFIQEGDVPINLSSFTSAAQMQSISRDIIIINLGIDYNYISELIIQTATLFDRIWLWNGTHYEYTMLANIINHNLISQPQESFNIQELDVIYNQVRQVSESQYLFYKNEVFIQFFIFYQQRQQIKGKQFPNYNIFYWSTERIKQSDFRYLSADFTYFCQISQNYRNVCISQAIRVFLEQNYDTSIMMRFKDEQIIVGQAVYNDFKYVGLLFNLAQPADFNLNCISDDQTGVVISFDFQLINYILISQENQYKDTVIQNRQYSQILPFPTKRFRNANLFLEYILDQSEIPMPITSTNGFLRKQAGYYVYQNLTDGFNVQVQLGQLKTLLRNQCSAFTTPNTQFSQHFVNEKFPDNEPKTIISPISIFPNSSLLEQNLKFEMDSLKNIQNQGFLKNLGFYYPLINNSLQMLSEFGDITQFKNEILQSLEYIMNLEVKAAQQILNKYVKVNILDADKSYMSESQFFCQKMNTIDYFIRQYPEMTIYPEKLILDSQSLLNLQQFNLSTKNQIFSPIIADMLLQSINQIIYQLKIYLYIHGNSVQKQEFLLYKNRHLQTDYFKNIWLDNDIQNSYYKIEQIQNIYVGINQNSFMFYNNLTMTTEFLHKNFNLLLNSYKNVQQINITRTQNIFITPIYSNSLDITNRPVEVGSIGIIGNIISDKFFQNKKLKNYYIFDYYCQPIVYDSQLNVDVILQSLLDIGFLAVYTTNYSIRQQFGQLSINEKFSIENNPNVSTFITQTQNTTLYNITCFGVLGNNLTINSELFVCRVKDSFIVTFDQLSILNRSFILGQINHYNYGKFTEINNFVLNISSTVQLYYNYTYRNPDQRNIIQNVSVNFNQQLMYGLEIDEIYSLCAVILLLIFFFLILKLSEQPINLIKDSIVSNQSEQTIDEKSIFEKLTNIHKLTSQKVKIFTIDTNKKFIFNYIPYTQVLFQQDYHAVKLNDKLFVTLNNKAFNPFAIISIICQKPNKMIPQNLEFHARANIFLNNKKSVQVNQKLQLGSGKFLIHSINHVLISPGNQNKLVSHYKLNDFGDLFQRNLDAPLPQLIEIEQEEPLDINYIIEQVCQ